MQKQYKKALRHYVSKRPKKLDIIYPARILRHKPT